LKTIQKSDLTKEETNNLHSDAKILLTLYHPNIIKLHKLFQDPSNFYIIYEYFTGIPILDHILCQDTFTENDIKYYFRTILQVLMFCHEQNIIFRYFWLVSNWY